MGESQAGIKIAGRYINKSGIIRYATETTLMVESEEEPKSLLIDMKEESKKKNAGLKFNIRKTNKQTKIMPSRLITSWHIKLEKVETVTDFIFLDSKITAVLDCSHEIKRQLFLGIETMKNIDSILKSRDITLLTKVHALKA